jgi:5-(carboxyamino)imidazole ribonucleotide synthase
MKPITLGILGGGQLGRMSAMAAARLGIKTIIFTPEKDSPASHVAAHTIAAEYSDKAALKKFAGMVDVISYEFENIPVETIKHLRKFKPVYPDERLLNIAQDRLKEKAFLNRIGIPTARWAAAKNPKNVENTLKKWGVAACIIKTARFGYDGKGQKLCRSTSDIAGAFKQFAGQALIVEEIVDFDCEISVIVGRGGDGDMVSYGPMMNEHRNHILSKTTFPARGVSKKLSAESVRVARKLAEAVNLRGVLALEMFVTKDGRIIANEIAPRTHNSGHWTMDACAMSQFETHVRAVCGLPLPPPMPRPARMINLIGDDINKIDQYLKQKNAHVHLYGKATVQPGRKMGHVNFIDF